MFSLLTDRFVQDAPTLDELMLLRATCPVPSLAAIKPAMHPAVVGVVDRALAFDPADRWPDARAMRAAVQEAWRALTDPPPGAARAGARPAAGGGASTTQSSKAMSMLDASRVSAKGANRLRELWGSGSSLLARSFFRR